MTNNSPHTFHIPVMGLAFTVDTPVKVARFGISSVISIIEDKLIELMRKHYYQETGRPYVPISEKEPDYRAQRITDYLNLVNTLVKEQLEKMRISAFEAGSDLVKYFEMLPEKSTLKTMYLRMTQVPASDEKDLLQKALREQICAGSIDVNIMTKVDKNNYDKTGNLLPDGSDAVAALKGYVDSELSNSSVIFSAGMNPRLFNYLEKVTAFDAVDYGHFRKKVVIKVSDYRSALIQGKYLAKKGIWVSEFRIESGLNCGGHAFASDGALLGPILEEFRTRRDELREALHSLYRTAIREKACPSFEDPHPMKITVQGGIGTHEEASFLHEHYQVQSTGWGTPFLLCPEATTVDEPTLALLRDAREKDVVLSKNSPLGVRFNYLKGTSSERERLKRIAQGRPGSPCTEKHLVSNTEFSKDPICTASHTYQKQKIAQLQSLGLPDADYQKQYTDVVRKECLCIGLMNSAVHTYKLPPVKKLEAVTVCPGPNIAYFAKIVSLREMVDHIYGRGNILTSPSRPNMFIKELRLNIDYLQERIDDAIDKTEKYVKEIKAFAHHLLEGIAYYRNLAKRITKTEEKIFIDQLSQHEAEVQRIITNADFPTA